ncbi:MAG: hypothetical protein QOH73_169 [Gaiellaceae bacterium]|nr:hypothetical protein [Gaiellaceae bacterium]
MHMGVPPGEKALRTVAVYLALLLLLRVGGKRQLAQMNTFDLIVLLLLSNVVQNAVIGNDNSLVGGLLGAAVLVAANYLIVRATFLHALVTRILQGSPTTLVHNGQVDDRALRHELITRAELDAVLRRQGVDGLGAVEEVVIEPEGSISATQKPQPSLQDVLDALQRIEARLAV